MLSSLSLRAQIVDSIDVPVETVLPVPGSQYHFSGVVKDKKTGEAVPFASITFKNSQIGAPADLDGVFDFQLEKLPNDTLLS